MESAEDAFPSGGRPKRFRNRQRQEAEDQENLDAQLRARQRERAAARARHGEVAVKIGRRKVTFAIVGDARRWGAATQANGASVRLAGRKIDPRDVRLSRLKDLSAYT